MPARLPDDVRLTCRKCGVRDEAIRASSNRLCRECLNAYSRERYAANREKRSEQRKAIRAANPERSRSYLRDYYAKHREHLLDQLHARRDADPARQLAYNAKWAASHPDYMREAARRRRARLAGVECTLTAAGWEEILGYFSHRCAYCLRRAGERGADGKLIRLTQDHIVPVSRGGAHTASNVIPACGECNSKKHDRGILVMLDAVDWIRRRRGRPVQAGRAADGHGPSDVEVDQPR